MPEIARTLATHRRLVLVAPPGAGKTTRVPPALLDGPGQVLVLQPRRLAARLAARRVAEERGEEVGDTVGYQVRFEEVAGPKTRLRFITEGLLERRLLSDPTLRGVSTVIFDEFHERHLTGDLALALVRRLQRTRADLAVLVMSATLESSFVSSYLDDCPVLRSEGRAYPVAIEHPRLPDERPVAGQVAAAVRRLCAEGLAGHVLAFLPGAGEIRAAAAACADLAAREGLRLLPLHGDLPPAEQDRAVRPSTDRKLILSTNVAETSVTIEGVVAVIDSGLARIPSHDPWSGLASLEVRRISRASAAQRAGRAGRTGPGRCLRLYTQHDHDTRPEFDVPEVRRLDPCEALLTLHALGVHASFDWLEQPPAAAVAQGELLLRRLGAVAADGALTEVGRRLLRFPLHPRQGRLLLAAEAEGVAPEACALAALLGERDIRGPEGRREARTAGASDLLELLQHLASAERAGQRPDRIKALGLNPGAAQGVLKARDQLLRLVKRDNPGSRDPAERETALLKAVLAGYPDRVARRRKGASTRAGGEDELLLCTGGSARLARESVVRDDEWLVAVDAQVRESGLPLVRLASAIEPDWLLDAAPDLVTESHELTWNSRLERVEAAQRLSYGTLVLDESRADPPGPEAARMLAEQARAKGLQAFLEPEALERLRGRVECVRAAVPDAVPALDDAHIASALEELCQGRRSFKELREASLLDALLASLGPGQARLRKLAPEHVTLPGGRKVALEYRRGQAPWLASRLQDFFGMADGPRVCDGRVPVVLHLNAPSGRPVQVTTDLAGFWERHYPSVRRELQRKYPRHAWPDDPRTATPPRAGKTR